MKKRDLIKNIREIARAAGFELTFVRKGGNHEIWAIGNQRLAIPRHREVNEHTARGIINRVKEVTSDEQ